MRIDDVNIHEIQDSSDEDWLRLRSELWPSLSQTEHQAELEQFVTNPRFKALMVRSPEGIAIGFAEAYLREDYVNGCETSPVAFLEGIFVRPEFRRQGVARRLCEAIEQWARAQGCSEFASDVLLENHVSQAMHIHLGFEETERVVYFKKKL
ncbi:MAG: aminoglycoside 6'-N-acetyltransferase [Leptolyngbyaceae bacterium]|nr:aminoglycoside 6'-N-acetyltransferase [Leptolyngbyaceae bacterium]